MHPPARHPNARALGETSLMFLVHNTISETEMRQVGEAIEKVMMAATAISRDQVGP